MTRKGLRQEDVMNLKLWTISSTHEAHTENSATGCMLYGSVDKPISPTLTKFIVRYCLTTSARPIQQAEEMFFSVKHEGRSGKYPTHPSTLTEMPPQCPL